MKRILTNTILILLCLFTQSSNAQNAGAFVDINKVMQAMPGYTDSLKHLDEIRLMYQNQYNYLLVDLQQKIKIYQSIKDSLAPMVANIKLQEIKQSQSNLDTFQAVANNALAMQQNESMKSFLTKIQLEVALLGSKKQLGTIWDSNMLKNAVWVDPKLDITQEVIQNMQNKIDNKIVKPGKSSKKKKNK